MEFFDDIKVRNRKRIPQARNARKQIIRKELTIRSSYDKIKTMKPICQSGITLKFMSYQGGNLIKTMKIAMETFIEKT